MRTFLLLVVLVVAGSLPASAQTELRRINEVEHRVSALETRVRQLSGDGLALFLFGAVCALWAQNTGRNAWLWFFLGFFFSVITVLVLLRKNAHDRRNSGRPPFNPPDHRQQ